MDTLVNEQAYFILSKTDLLDAYKIIQNHSTKSKGPLNNVFINVSVIDNNIDAVGYSWNNVNYTAWDEIKGTDYWVYKTLAMNGTYTYYTWVNDSTGNMNRTEVRSVTKGQLCRGASIKVTTVDVASNEKKVTVTV